ncbi:hypothetical protein [Sphingobium sp. Leaf26]|uniref:hypothetical protein n=1 Tax=Sphingobium sp. Leaf26 TaxID=1735693 RepID=UPI0012E1EE04|nr:hypothetical protein [Sphingobium sp. Leaf26]
MTTFSERSRYRFGSIALIAASCLALAGVLIGVADWLSFLVAAPLLALLIVITYRRLRDGGFSGAWVGLMILSFGIGPTWHVSDLLTVSLGGAIIGCVPVILGWVIPSKGDARSEPQSV